MDELIARIRVLFRRNNSLKNNELILADLVMDITGQKVSRNGKLNSND